MTSKRGFVYVLHFNQNLSHAWHYIGCTASPLARFKRHACGHGSRILRALIEQGTGFSVGTLATCTLERMRKIERNMKDQKNAERYCGCCHDNPKQFAGTIQYPFEWKMPNKAQADEFPQIQFTCTPAMDCWPHIIGRVKDLMNENDGLGFVPVSNGETNGTWELLKNGTFAAAILNGKLIGFAAYTINQYKFHAKIHLCCVDDEYRMMGVGRQLVKIIAEKETGPDAYHCKTTDRTACIREIICTVRNDLAATKFWEACGFQRIQFRTHGTSGSTLIDYRCPLDWSNGTLMNDFTKEEQDNGNERL